MNLIFKAGRFAKAVWKRYRPVIRRNPLRLTTAGKNAGLVVIAQRLSTCATCDYRDGEHCGVCECRLQWKSRWDTESCPEGFW